jgi:hypothetical protein
MGTTARQKTAGKINVDRRRYFATDVVGDVTGMPVDGLRLANARSLLARPAVGVGAGHLEGSLGCLRPAHPSAPASPELVGSGAARMRWHKRSGRPRSAIGGGRF